MRYDGIRVDIRTLPVIDLFLRRWSIPELRLFLLGSPRIERDGAPVRVDTAKAIALLAYLAVTESSQRRETLVGLLWPESDQQHGRAALRRTLSALKEALAGDWILADREAIRLEPAARAFVDVLLFRDRLAARRTHGHRDADMCPGCLGLLGDAVALYHGDFLQGFSLRDSVNFDDWQHHQGELLRQELDGALDRLARGYAARGEYETALGHARRRLAADPLNEAAHCQLMELYTWAGQRPAALRQYGACARILHAELGATPQRATTSLYRDIAAGRIGPETANAGWAVGLHPSPAAPSFPEQGLAGISRETERFVTILCVEVGARAQRVQEDRDGSLDGIVLTPARLRDRGREHHRAARRRVAQPDRQQHRGGLRRRRHARKRS
jgi:DNA-binding SARP family transcriptional activator